MRNNYHKCAQRAKPQVPAFQPSLFQAQEYCSCRQSTFHIGLGDGKAPCGVQGGNSTTWAFHPSVVEIHVRDGHNSLLHRVLLECHLVVKRSSFSKYRTCTLKSLQWLCLPQHHLLLIDSQEFLQCFETVHSQESNHSRCRNKVPEGELCVVVSHLPFHPRLFFFGVVRAMKRGASVQTEFECRKKSKILDLATLSYEDALVLYEGLSEIITSYRATIVESA